MGKAELGRNGLTAVLDEHPRTDDDGCQDEHERQEVAGQEALNAVEEGRLGATEQAGVRRPGQAEDADERERQDRADARTGRTGSGGSGVLIHGAISFSCVIGVKHRSRLPAGCRKDNLGECNCAPDKKTRDPEIS